MADIDGIKGVRQVKDGIEVDLEVGEVTFHPGFDPKLLIQLSIARSLMRIADALEKQP